jgi:integrase
MKRLPGFRYDAKAQLAHFEVVLPGTGGKRRRRVSEAAADVIAATTKYHAFRKRVLDGSIEVPLTFAGYVERYGAEIQKNVKPGTAVRERRYLAQLLPHFGKLQMKRITAADVKGFVSRMKADSYDATTINNAYGKLRKYLLDAVDRGVLEAFPIRERPRAWRQKEPKLRLEFSEEERAAFLSAFDDEAGFRDLVTKKRSTGTVATSVHFGGKPRSFGAGRRPDGKATAKHFEHFRASREFFIVALETGLSRGDLFLLPWAAVDLKEGLLRIPREKTGEESLVAISDPLRAALAVLQKRAMARKKERELVLGGCSESVIRRYLATAKRLAGIERRFRLHDLRHSFASRHSAHGTPLQVIQKMLGHASVKTTERYSRVDVNAVKAAVRALDLNSAVNSGTPEAPPAEHGGLRGTDSKKAS